MSSPRFLAPIVPFALCLAIAVPAAAKTATLEDNEFDLSVTDGEAEAVPAQSEASQPEGRVQTAGRQGPPGGFPGGKPVFDETWATVGIGAGLVPSYSGSDNYIVFPLPLIVGRVGGIGVSPNGPGFALDFLSEAPSGAPPETSFSFGPAFRFRNDRDGDIEDPVVELTEDLETAIEVGAQGGVSFPGVFKRGDRVSLSTQVRWDILGAHNGMLIEPSVGYFTPIGRGMALQLSGNLSFVDDDFADYYYTVTPQQSADSGLPLFTADGGLNSVGALAILTVDLDGNVLNGGFNIYGIGGYSRLVGDAADTPFTSIQGSANQLIGGIGIGYTF
ncbi:MipA/OmpV family protein [Erythrobacter ani]|uniref:MipA/OmpV family protein n=1 Tax=Erythrobacter ani TaxID=2827235 RepID=A0ABS6SNC8_9SPHN|nr:MipA/OmpV family protein [Erythrobacter ani]MBV7266154.1 MipA/OmpV family protein [Erythrobacter ani]